MNINICPQCQTQGSLVDEEAEGCVTCESCGYVVAEGSLRSEVEYVAQNRGFVPSGVLVSSMHGLPTSTFLPKRYRSFEGNGNYARQLILMHCKRVSDTLGLAKSYEDQITHMTTKAMNGRPRYGRKAEMIVAACAYIICRLNSKPVTLLDVADGVQCNVFELGRVFQRVAIAAGVRLQELDPAMLLERACSKLEMRNDQRRNVTDQAVRILNVAKEDWLVTGRKPVAITAGAIALAMEMLDMVPSLAAIGETLNTSFRTVGVRLRELKVTFVKLGNGLLPWGGDITVKNIVLHMRSILEQLDFRNEFKKRRQAMMVLEEVEDDVKEEDELKELVKIKLPPSYSKNASKRETRRLKLVRARARIERLMDNNKALAEALSYLPIAVKSEEDEEGSAPPPPPPPDDEPLDQEDLMIERLFLQGVDENSILEGYYDSLVQELPPSCNASQEEPELGERDIPDSEIHEFLRTTEEVAMLSSIYSDEPPTKRQRM